MPDLTTVERVKQFLPLSSSNTTDDQLLARLVAAASAVVSQYCGRTFTTASHVETRDGTGATALVCRQAPITAVTSLTIGGQPLALSTQPGQRGYYVSDPITGVIALEGATFTRGRGNVVLTYTAGFATTPADVEQAVIDLIALKYRGRDRVGLVSKGIQGETTAFFVGALPADVRQVLDQHRRVSL